MTAVVGKVLGYAVIGAVGEEAPWALDWSGVLADTPEDARRYFAEPGDVVVAISEVTQ